MPILYGAVAYREDLIPQFEGEINSWDLEKRYPHPVACPKGGACDKTYLLISEINAADGTVAEQIDIVLKAMEHEDCSAHSPRIRINAPG
jgi:hypothetical protein